jgi:hypothetical protein
MQLKLFGQQMYPPKFTCGRDAFFSGKKMLTSSSIQIQDPPGAVAVDNLPDNTATTALTRKLNPKGCSNMSQQDSGKRSSDQGGIHGKRTKFDTSFGGSAHSGKRKVVKTRRKKPGLEISTVGEVEWAKQARTPRGSPKKAAASPRTPRSAKHAATAVAFDRSRTWGQIIVSSETATKVRQLFNTLDTSGRGHLTAHDFVTPGTWDRASHLFFAELQKFLHDENGDGVIDQGEFMDSFVKCGLETACPIAAGTSLTLQAWGGEVQTQINKIVSDKVGVVLAAAQSHIGSMETDLAHLDQSAYPGPALKLSDDVIGLMGNQFDRLDADGGGTIERHEVPAAIWKELDTHFNQDGDFEIDRPEYIQAVKEVILGTLYTILIHYTHTLYSYTIHHTPYTILIHHSHHTHTPGDP